MLKNDGNTNLAHRFIRNYHFIALMFLSLLTEIMELKKAEYNSTQPFSYGIQTRMLFPECIND